jgi:hypothetical protein
MLHPSTLRR